MKIYKSVFLILFSLCLTPSVFAENVVVIVNAANSQSLSVSDIKGIYSDNIIQWKDGTGIKVYDLPVKQEAREMFSQQLLGTSARATAKEWANRKITNTAKNPPKTKKERLVVAFVGKKKNAIGYVNESAVEGKKGVKVIMTLK